MTTPVTDSRAPAVTTDVTDPRRTPRARIFDARPILAAGAEPLAAIMETAAKTGADEILVIYAPFEPIPLQGVLGEQGFTHVTDKIDDDTWRVIFVRR